MQHFSDTLVVHTLPLKIIKRLKSALQLHVRRTASWFMSMSNRIINSMLSKQILAVLIELILGFYQNFWWNAHTLHFLHL